MNENLFYTLFVIYHYVLQQCSSIAQPLINKTFINKFTAIDRRIIRPLQTFIATKYT